MATLTDERKQLRAPRNELGAARKELGAARKVAKGRTEYSVRLLTVSVRLAFPFALSAILNKNRGAWDSNREPCAYKSDALSIALSWLDNKYC